MAVFKLKRGYNIRIAGKPDGVFNESAMPRRIAMQPIEYPGIKPRLLVKEGDAVKIGTPLIADKAYPEIQVVAPVSGKIAAIIRGERRVLTEIVIDNDGKDDAVEHKAIGDGGLKSIDREKLIKALLNGGVWPLLKRRPFSKLALPDVLPRDIFISGMDTAPLAADPGMLMKGEEENFQLGIRVLQKLTDGDVYLSMDGNRSDVVPAFEKAEGIIKNTFSGPHPAGNVGVQIHHIKPIGNGETVWTITPAGVCMLGKFIKTGLFPRERVIAVAGSALQKREYFKTIVGTPVAEIISEDNIQVSTPRYIDGNILTGRKITRKGYVGYYTNLLSVIPEGKKKRKLFGYILPGFNVPSFSKTYFSALFPKKEYELDTLLHGAHRAFVQTGSYERVVPMEILPVYLMKSIMADDIEEMEKLGILELDEEDVALCSYICLSKMDFGATLRRGLNLIEKEG